MRFAAYQGALLLLATASVALAVLSADGHQLAVKDRASPQAWSVISSPRLYMLSRNPNPSSLYVSKKPPMISRVSSSQ